MGSMYLKPLRIQSGFAPSVVEFATVVFAGQQKDGLPLVFSTGRLLSKPCLNFLYFLFYPLAFGAKMNYIYFPR